MLSDEHQYCTFFLGDLFFGLEVTCVQEILRYQEMTRVPLASPVVCGLINLRGQIVTAIDLRRRLGLADRAADHLPINMIVQTRHGAVSLLVDDVGDVLSVHADQFEQPPETLRGPARELIAGAYKLEDRLMLILNAEQAVMLSHASRGENALSVTPDRTASIPMPTR